MLKNTKRLIENSMGYFNNSTAPEKEVILHHTDSYEHIEACGRSAQNLRRMHSNNLVHASIEPVPPTAPTPVCEAARHAGPIGCCNRRRVAAMEGDIKDDVKKLKYQVISAHLKEYNLM